MNEILSHTFPQCYRDNNVVCYRFFSEFTAVLLSQETKILTLRVPVYEVGCIRSLLWWRSELQLPLYFVTPKWLLFSRQTDSVTYTPALTDSCHDTRRDHGVPLSVARWRDDVGFEAVAVEVEGDLALTSPKEGAVRGILSLSLTNALKTYTIKLLNCVGITFNKIILWLTVNKIMRWKYLLKLGRCDHVLKLRYWIRFSFRKRVCILNTSFLLTAKSIMIYHV